MLSNRPARRKRRRGTSTPHGSARTPVPAHRGHIGNGRAVLPVLQDELDLASKLDGYERAQKDYRSAQNVLGSVRANDFGELSLKSMASMAYEGAILDDPSARHHLRNEKQIVAWSIAFDVTLLLHGRRKPRRSPVSSPRLPGERSRAEP